MLGHLASSLKKSKTYSFGPLVSSKTFRALSAAQAGPVKSAWKVNLHRVLPLKLVETLFFFYLTDIIEL